MTYEQAMTANRVIIWSWIDDTPEHDIEDRYVRSVLTRFVARRNATDPTIGHVQHLADSEQVAADAAEDEETRMLCNASAEVLRNLARILHGVDE